jgi:hypothetical protein
MWANRAGCQYIMHMELSLTFQKTQIFEHIPCLSLPTFYSSIVDNNNCKHMVFAMCQTLFYVLQITENGHRGSISGKLGFEPYNLAPVSMPMTYEIHTRCLSWFLTQHSQNPYNFLCGVGDRHTFWYVWSKSLVPNISKIFIISRVVRISFLILMRWLSSYIASWRRLVPRKTLAWLKYCNF